jgi:hypothetical protein
VKGAIGRRILFSIFILILGISNPGWFKYKFLIRADNSTRFTQLLTIQYYSNKLI